MFSTSGEMQTCGRWVNSELVDECAIPRAVLPAGTLLPPTVATKASLIFPDGSFLVGDFDDKMHPRAGTVRYTAQGLVHPQQTAAVDSPSSAAASAAASASELARPASDSRARSGVIDLNVSNLLGTSPTNKKGAAQ